MYVHMYVGYEYIADKLPICTLSDIFWLCKIFTRQKENCHYCLLLLLGTHAHTQPGLSRYV